MNVREAISQREGVSIQLLRPQRPSVWAEAFRVLRRGGVLLAGFNDPTIYLFDYVLTDVQVKHAFPYSDLTSLPPEERQQYIKTGAPLEFNHTLEDQIGG